MVLLSGEDEARVRLLKQLGDGCLTGNHTSTSQCEIQVNINCRILSSLKENASLRDRAWLNTIAALMVVIGFGCSYVSIPPKVAEVCVCGTILDPYGDHLLSCGQGPLRTKRHDALCEIAYHALLTDNKNVKREQHCSGSVDNHPGDVYHSDFSEGQSGFFDVMV